MTVSLPTELSGGFFKIAFTFGTFYIDIIYHFVQHKSFYINYDKIISSATILLSIGGGPQSVDPWQTWCEVPAYWTLLSHLFFFSPRPICCTGNTDWIESGWHRIVYNRKINNKIFMALRFIIKKIFYITPKNRRKHKTGKSHKNLSKWMRKQLNLHQVQDWRYRAGTKKYKIQIPNVWIAFKFVCLMFNEDWINVRKF